MKKIKAKQLSGITFMIGIMMISLGLVVQNNNNLKAEKYDMATSINQIAKKSKNNEKVEKLSFDGVEMETAPASVMRVEVFDGKTMEELSAQLNKSLGGILAGHGNTIAAHSLKVGVDPYIVTAIMMHETGNGTSRIANGCYNFGGQKGSGCGAWKRYNSVDEGLTGMIDNLYNNYYAHGLTTVEAIGSRYAESGTWPSMINWYISQIKSR